MSLEIGEEAGEEAGDVDRRLELWHAQPLELQELIAKGVVPTDADANDPEVLFDLMRARLLLYNPMTVKLSRPAYKRLHLMYGAY